MVAGFYVTRVALGFALAFGVQEPPREPLPEIVSAKVVEHSALTIKPCQYASIIVEVEVDRPILAGTWMRLVQSMSQVLRVNGVEYHNRLSSDSSTLNEAGAFALVAPPRLRGPETGAKYQRGKVLMQFSLYGKERACLFREKGRYEIELIPEGPIVKVQVTVEEPTATEREIVEALRDENVHLFLLDPTNRQFATPETLALIERFARADTDYKKWLSLSLGLGLYHARNFDSRDEEKSRALAEQVYSWFSPYCTGEITSRLEAIATYWCAMHLGWLGRATEDKSKSPAYFAQQVELLRKLADSPYGFDEGAMAREALAHIDAEAKAKPEGANP